MKDLKKLAIILRALGITANVVSEQITCNDEIVSNNTFCECLKGGVRLSLVACGKYYGQFYEV